MCAAVSVCIYACICKQYIECAAPNELHFMCYSTFECARCIRFAIVKKICFIAFIYNLLVRLRARDCAFELEKYVREHILKLAAAAAAFRM